MSSASALTDLLRNVKIFASYDAAELDASGKPLGSLKPLFDGLYQRAIDLKLANSAVFLSTGCSPELLSLTEAIAQRPRWYPANRVSKLKASLVQLRVQSFQRSWLRLRLLAEPPSRRGTLWDNDPALVFEAGPQMRLCRTACVGHEGHVFFFAYAKEREWEKALAQANLSLFGEGEDAYRQLVPEPGAIAG